MTVRWTEEVPVAARFSLVQLVCAWRVLSAVHEVGGGGGVSVCLVDEAAEAAVCSGGDPGTEELRDQLIIGRVEDEAGRRRHGAGHCLDRSRAGGAIDGRWIESFARVL